MATYLRLPSKSLIHGPLKKEVFHKTPQYLAYIEPLACAIHAVNRADIQFSDVVVISGCGPIGLGAVAAARRKNPRLLIALDCFEFKLKVAKKCGADLVFRVLPDSGSHSSTTSYSNLNSSGPPPDPDSIPAFPPQALIRHIKDHHTPEGLGCDKYLELTGHPSSVT